MSLLIAIIHLFIFGRRVVGALRERLERAEAALMRRGMRSGERRDVFPWSRPVLERVRQWLGSYLAHLDRASSRGLLLSLRRRFSWLDEYFIWNTTSVGFRCPVPRLALRFAQQRSWFLDHLPGHVLMIQQGTFCERITDGVSGDARSECGTLAAIEAWPRRFPRRRLAGLGRLLWAGELPVAWIGETGRRPGNIAERVLLRRWAAPGVHPGVHNPRTVEHSSYSS